MRTNELKKGDRVRLANGWKAVIMDNKRGNIRLAEVHGLYTELGSIYAHDIEVYYGPDALYMIEHTPAQIKLRKLAGAR